MKKTLIALITTMLLVPTPAYAAVTPTLYMPASQAKNTARFAKNAKKSKKVVLISSGNMILTVGESEKADVSFNGEKGKIKWKTSNKKVATVSSKGKLRPSNQVPQKLTLILKRGTLSIKVM